MSSLGDWRLRVTHSFSKDFSQSLGTKEPDEEGVTPMFKF